MISVKCDCGETLSVSSESAGKEKCPHCGRVIARASTAGAHAPRFSLRQSNPAHALALSPDGRLLAVAGGADAGAGNGRKYLGEVTLYDLADGSPQISLPGHRSSVSAVAFSPDSQWLVTAEKSDWLHVWNVSRGLWDVVMGLPERAFRAHKGPITSVRFSPDGRWLASAGGEGEVRLWNASAWRQETVWSTGRAGAVQVAFSPSGDRLAAAWRSKGPIVVWHLPTRETIVQLRLRTEEDAEHLALSFVGGDVQLAALGPKELRLWDVSACQVLTTVETPGMQCFAAAAKADLLAVAGWDVSRQLPIRLFNSSGREVGQLGGHNLPVSAIVVAADGLTMATAGRERRTNVWALKSIEALPVE